MTKVVSLKQFQEKKNEPKSVPAIQAPNNTEFDFSEVMRIKAENEARMKKDRAKANKGVIRSYNLKK